MTFRPEVNQELRIDGGVYRIAEHPAAPGVPYGQEGRQAIVYQLTPSSSQGEGLGGKRALKVFKPCFRSPALVSLAERIAPFADLPGLEVCRRTVLTPQRHAALLRRHPDLVYAVVMPWVEGPTWMEVMVDGRPLGLEGSLALARALVEVLATMEQRGVAHCDLSAPNLLLPGLAGGQGVALVDVEGLYGPGLDRPAEVLSGSQGYAHKSAAEGLWGPEADRFAGAVLLAEILGWCDERVREAAWGESYFEPGEMQEESDRYRLLVRVLRERWGGKVAMLFERAWRSEVLRDAPTFGEWLMMLPEQAPAPARVEEPQKEAESQPGAEALHSVIALAQQMEAEGKAESALEVYRQALAMAPTGGALAEELHLIITRLESEVAGLYPVPEPDSHFPAIPLTEGQTTVEKPPVPRSEEEDAVAGLFDAGLMAYRRGEWAEAAELLGEVVRRRPWYARGGQAAKVLWEEARRKLTAGRAQEGRQARPTEQESTAPRTEAPPKRRSLWKWGVIGVPLVACVVLAVASLACLSSSAQRSVTTRSSSAPSSTSTPIPSNGSTRTPTRTPTPVPIAWPVLAGTPVPQPRVAISPENADEVVQLARLDKDVVADVAYAPDGRLLAVVASFGIYLYNTETLAEEQFIETDAFSAAFSPDGATLASGSSDGAVRLWRVSDGQLLRAMQGHTDAVLSVTFSPDGMRLASGAADDTVRLWRVADGSPLRTLAGHTGTVYGVAFSPDGATLASGSADGTVRLWQVADGTLLRTLAGHTDRVFSVAFSPDGAMLASGSRDTTMRLWRVADGALLRTLEGDEVWVNSVAFSPDGVMLSSGLNDGTVRLWRVLDGRLLRTLEGHTSWVLKVTFSPNGLMLASGAGDNTVRLWGVAP